jgi:glycosyltransferase involved in cell wall biosynthesis
MTVLVGCMMAMNAAEVLTLSLPSLRASTDEVVFVDGGSTDDSRAIAVRMGATLVDSPWPGHNATQRQVYLDHLQHRLRDRSDVWAVVLDSDEVLAGRPVRDLVGDLEHAGHDFAMVARMWLVDTKSGLRYIASRPHYPDFQLRVFKVGPGLSYTGKVHEVLHGLRSGVKTRDTRLLHLDLLRATTEERKAKIDRYERIERGSGLPRFYRFERYGYVLKPLPDDSGVDVAALRGVARYVMAERGRRGRELLAPLTGRPLDGLEWLQRRARRLPGRLERAGRQSLRRIRGLAHRT